MGAVAVALSFATALSIAMRAAAEPAGAASIEPCGLAAVGARLPFCNMTLPRALRQT